MFSAGAFSRIAEEEAAEEAAAAAARRKAEKEAAAARQQAAEEAAAATARLKAKGTVLEKIVSVIKSQNTPGGSSRQAITKGFEETFGKTTPAAFKSAIAKGTESEVLRQDGQRWCVRGQEPPPLPEKVRRAGYHWEDGYADSDNWPDGISKCKIYLNVAFHEKELAKAKGARWDPEKRKWYVWATDADDIPRGPKGFWWFGDEAYDGEIQVDE
jgi:hypothetical protein